MTRAARRSIGKPAGMLPSPSTQATAWALLVVSWREGWLKGWPPAVVRQATTGVVMLMPRYTTMPVSPEFRRTKQPGG